MNKTNMVIGQSGGPTPVINASLLGAVEQALQHERIEGVYGSINGLKGILEGELISLHDKLPQLRRASAQPGAILGMSRHPLVEEEYDAIIRHMEKVNAGIFCYIGGNGSSRTVLALHNYARSLGKDLRFVHIPKTIDNDLEGTDHSPGYGCAAKFLSHMVQLFALDMLALQSKPRVEIIEVMGGNRGWLPAASAMFKSPEASYPHLVYLPDQPIEAELMLSEVDNAFKGKSIIVVVPDHLKINIPGDDSEQYDPIRGYQAGTGFKVSQYISSQLGISTRVTVPNALYRIAPGFISATDLQEAHRLGRKAVDFAVEGYSGGMVGLVRQTDVTYRCSIEWISLEHVAGLEKPFPPDFWDAKNHLPTQGFLDYVLPLIDRETSDLLYSLK